MTIVGSVVVRVINNYPEAKPHGMIPRNIPTCFTHLPCRRGKDWFIRQGVIVSIMTVIAIIYPAIIIPIASSTTWMDTTV
jgi:hypothetical protein